MKIRNGFVSNSSSSSFVLIATKEAYDRFMKTANAIQKKVLEAIGSEDKVFGTDVIAFETFDVNGYTSWDQLKENLDLSEAVDEDEEGNPIDAVGNIIKDDPYEIFSEFQGSLKENEYWRRTIDF